MKVNSERICIYDIPKLKETHCLFSFRLSGFAKYH